MLCCCCAGTAAGWVSPPVFPALTTRALCSGYGCTTFELQQSGQRSNQARRRPGRVVRGTWRVAKDHNHPSGARALAKGALKLDYAPGLDGGGGRDFLGVSFLPKRNARIHGGTIVARVISLARALPLNALLGNAGGGVAHEPRFLKHFCRGCGSMNPSDTETSCSTSSSSTGQGEYAPSTPQPQAIGEERNSVERARGASAPPSYVRETGSCRESRCDDPLVHVRYDRESGARRNGQLLLQYCCNTPT